MPEKPNQQGTADQWFTVGGHDLQSAKLLFEQQGPTDTITVLIQQAAEKYLKGYLLARGWKLKKTHDLELLVAEAAKLDKAFEQFLDLARTLSGYYLRNRYPHGYSSVCAIMPELAQHVNVHNFLFAAKISIAPIR